jgi:hypothetical protein
LFLYEHAVFTRGVVKVFALLGRYAALVTNYQLTLYNMQEGQRFKVVAAHAVKAYRRS